MAVSQADENRIIAQCVIRMCRRELAKRDLLAFAQWTKPDYIVAPHHEMIAAHLMDIVKKRTDRLYIGMPPRHGKSELASVRFAAFYLGMHPDHNIIHVSHTAALSHGFSRQVRSLVRDNPLYREIFPNVRLDPESQSVSEWKTTAGGGFLSLGTGGAVTGHGADLLLIDDVHKEGDADSPSTLDAVYTWYSTAARTRLAPGAAIVFIMTRWHKKDLMGRLLDLMLTDADADRWETLVLPGLALDNDPLGRDPGEALWPDRFDRESLLRLKALSDRQFQALIQQNPRGSISQMFRRENFNVVRFPDRGPAVWFFDLAVTEGERSDYTAWARCQYDANQRVLCVSRVARFRAEFPRVKRAILRLMRAAPAVDRFVFHHKSYDLIAFQTLRNEFEEPWRVSSVVPDGDVVARALPIADLVESGRVLIWGYAPVVEAWLQEFDDFPEGQHDDPVAVLSLAGAEYGLASEFRVLIDETELEESQDDRAYIAGF